MRRIMRGLLKYYSVNTKRQELLDSDPTHLMSSISYLLTTHYQHPVPPLALINAWQQQQIFLYGLLSLERRISEDHPVGPLKPSPSSNPTHFQWGSNQVNRQAISYNQSPSPDACEVTCSTRATEGNLNSVFCDIITVVERTILLVTKS